jgi:hypothetical protein
VRCCSACDELQHKKRTKTTAQLFSESQKNQHRETNTAQQQQREKRCIDKQRAKGARGKKACQSELSSVSSQWATTDRKKNCHHEEHKTEKCARAN